MAKIVTLEEKIAKAVENARKKAEAEGLDEATTQEMVNEAVEKAKAAYEKSAKEKIASYTVHVKNNPDFCGIGAGGIQFANGEATVTSGRMAEWFREHDGYEVITK
ncbi:MAG: hypothetical protein HDQ96_04760 [Lachnospiraceae bacterium]|nr:hypothetical protein [Lachnospiraceae bacterium]